MSDERSQELTHRLRKAEEAANYMERLGSLASEAPALRERVNMLQRLEQRERYRREALERARVALAAASGAQQTLPELVASAANLVNQVANTLREVDTFRREATTLLSVVDRMNYEDELDQAMEQPDDGDSERDVQSIRMLVASRHGSTRVRQMIDDLSPGFEVFARCDLDAVPMRRELTNLLMAQLAAEAEANRPQSQFRPAPALPPQVSRPEPVAAAGEAPGGGV